MSKIVTYDLYGNEVDPESEEVIGFQKQAVYADNKRYDIPVPEPKMSCRETILEEAKRCICQDRQNQYGAPEDSFLTIAELWNTYLSDTLAGYTLKPSDVAIMMVLLKVARTKGHKGHSDNYVDMAGYAAIAAELAKDERLKAFDEE